MSESLDSLPQDKNSDFKPEVLDVLFEGSPATHDALWRDIPPSEAAFVRRAVIRAQEIRSDHEDPGDAYLQGIAVALSASRHQRQPEVDTDDMSKVSILRLVIDDDSSAVA